MVSEGYVVKLKKWYEWYLKSQMVIDVEFAGNASDLTDFSANSYVFKYWDKNG